MPVAALGPSTCLSDTAHMEAAVYGSFPYHGRSSACLVAIHAGVFISRVYRHDWSNAATHTSLGGPRRLSFSSRSETC